MYGVLQRIWRLLPESARSNQAIARARDSISSRFRRHKQTIYTKEYYLSDVEDAAKNSAGGIVESVCDRFNPQSVADVGCGTGVLLETFADRGIQVLGLEYSDAGCQLTRERGVTVESFDVRHDQLDSEWGRFDVVCCTEVAEHIPDKYADRLIDVLTTLSDRVIFTAATPGQGGTDHVNEQPNDYWIEKYHRQQFEFDRELTSGLSDSWKQAGVVQWYWENLLVFVRADTDRTED